jgi:hypothetical protein
MKDERGDVSHCLHLRRGSVREHDAGDRSDDDADHVLIGIIAKPRVKL